MPCDEIVRLVQEGQEIETEDSGAQIRELAQTLARIV